MLDRPPLDPGERVARRYGLRRSPKWRAVARDHLVVQPCCVSCASRRELNVHHIFPFHFCVHLGRADLELDHRNLITLCASHHLLLGHLDDFESANLSVVRHARHTFHALSAAQLEASRAWEDLVKRRLPTLSKMSPAERVWFRMKMNETFPRKG